MVFLKQKINLFKKSLKNTSEMLHLSMNNLYWAFFHYQVELSCPKEMAWKVNMYRGYLAICHPEEQQLNFIERLVEMASSLAIREWRRLPHVVSHVHTPLLQVRIKSCLNQLFSGTRSQDF